MSYLDLQFAELQALVADLGKDGGLISPSVYDTAQVIRLYPPAEGPQPALDWLLQQQHSDGGWGEPSAPYARDVPTLAATLALHRYPESPKHRAAMAAGLDFLEKQAGQWVDLPIDALPIATEMILPYLIEEAHRAGLTLERKPYAKLYHLRDRKCRMISAMPLQVNSPPTYSWEALGRSAHSISPDCSGGIGHSPAATAAWLAQAAAQPDLSNFYASASQYLTKAAAATGVAIPGVVPNVWPITGFELSYGLFVLLITDLLHQPEIAKAAKGKVEELNSVMKHGNGVSFGDYFTPDVDETGVALAVLQAAGYAVDSSVVLQFKNGDHFCTFQQELNPSILANAHALYSLAHTGVRYKQAEDFLLQRRCADGRWLSDKWHSSWLYTTLEVILAFEQLGYSTENKETINTILSLQNADGGWGIQGHSTRLETSYAVIALATFQKQGLLSEKGKYALQQGQEWLNCIYRPQTSVDSRLWLGKELYTPYRVDRIYELSALLLATAQKENCTQ